MEIDSKFIHELKLPVKRWLARAIAGIICADKIVHEKELKFLELTLAFLENQHEIDEILELIRTKKLPVLSQLRDINRVMAFRILVIITKIAIVDQRFTNSEAEFLKIICNKLGFNKYIAKHFLKWAVDSITLNRRLEDLLRLAKASETIYDDGD